MKNNGYLKLNNWDKYQARTDKDMPWVKLWGNLFNRDWWQYFSNKKKLICLVFLDAGRIFGNKIPNSRAYFRRNYNIFMTEKEWFETLNSLRDIGFLSDYTSDVTTPHIREEKIREDTTESDNTSKGGSYDERFLEFWEKYPRKVAKKSAFLAFRRLRLKDDAFKHVMGGLERAKQTKQWQAEGGRYIPHPTTWLNQERWNDEHESQRPTPRTRIVV